MIALAGLLAAIALFLSTVGMKLYRMEPLVRGRLARYGEGSEALDKDKPKPSYVERHILPAARWAARRFVSLKRVALPGNAEQLLIYAGHPYNMNVDEFFGLQVMGILVGALWGLLVGGMLGGVMVGIFGAILLGVGGVWLIPLWLDGQANKRQRAISLAVPDSLEILVTCVEAGMGFDAALRHIVRDMEGPLAEEYGLFLHELQMGVPREECFRRLLARNRAEELQTVVSGLVQGQELGVPVAQTLATQAEEMRVRRIQRAKEEGAKASPKISLVTTMIIAPAVMCLFLSVVVHFSLRDFGPLVEGFIGGP